MISPGPERVASYFTEDTIFKGPHPYSVGRQGIADYYGSQPLGMTATYKILETRRLASDLVLMAPTINSYILTQHIPNAELVIYPDSGHGALFQYAPLFVSQAAQFLDSAVPFHAS